MSQKVSAPRDLVISLPDPRLRQNSQKVGLITPEITQLIATMKDATLDWEDHREHEVGVALAAVQIGVMQRVVIVRSDIDDRENRRFHVFINPEITKHEGELITDLEGCLSVPGMYGRVARYDKVRVKALDENGKEFRVNAEGFLARVFQHEIDHTKGKVYIDYIKDQPEAFFKLADDGKIVPLNYDTEIANNSLLW